MSKEKKNGLNGVDIDSKYLEQVKSFNLLKPTGYVMHQQA
jgi:hypothetical protein